MFTNHLRASKGFTLIEVLVVVAIISILTAILVANYNEARKNSRDKVRMSDLKSLQLAVELYKAQYGQYPAQGCGTAGTQFAGPGPMTVTWASSCEEYISGLAPQFVPSLPKDPSQENVSNTGYFYATDATRQSYKIMAALSVESKLITAFSDEFSRFPRDCGFGGPQPTVYAVYSAGAECW